MFAPGTSVILGSTVRAGFGPPGGNEGLDGDYYLDMLNLGFYYGPRTSGSWGNAQVLVPSQVDLTDEPKNTGVVAGPGVNPLASSAGHVHGRQWWAPEDQGFISWTQDPATTASGTMPGTAGQMNFARLHVPNPATITNVVLFLSVAGSGLTSGENFAGLYSATGSFIAGTADQTTNWASTGTKVMALTQAQPVAAGDYLVGFFYNGTTAPSVLRGVSQSVVNAGLTGATSRFGTGSSGNTTALPGSIGTMAGTSNSWWAALS